MGRPVLTHTKHFSGHVVVKSNSLAVPSGGDTKQRLLEWMVRPGRPSSKLWHLSARWKRAALSLGSRPEFRILESHFTFASGSPPPSLSLSLTVSSSTTGRFPNVRHDNARRGTAFDDLAQHRRIRSIPSKLNGTAVARDEGSRSAIRAITRGTRRRIMVGCNW